MLSRSGVGGSKARLLPSLALRSRSTVASAGTVAASEGAALANGVQPSCAQIALHLCVAKNSAIPLSPMLPLPYPEPLSV